MPVFTYSYTEVADTFRAIHRGEGETRTLRKQLEITTSFAGAPASDVLTRLENGYEFTSLPDSVLPDAHTGDGSKWRYSDDGSNGEYQYELDEAGEPDYYLERIRDKTKPGIRVDVSCSFAGAVSSKLINDYGYWVGRMVSSLEANGHDVELAIYDTGDGGLTNGADKNLTARIIVSKFGEPMFVKDWAPLFAAGGYRHLMFTALRMASLPSRGSHSVSSGLGKAVGRGWDVTWNPDTQTLVVLNDCRGSKFPADEMTEKLRLAQTLIDG